MSVYVERSPAERLSDLAALVDAGAFHHATYRCVGTVWEGLWIYRTSPDGFRGYEVAFSFPKGVDADDAQAFINSKGIGTHVGAYGCG